MSIVLVDHINPLASIAFWGDDPEAVLKEAVDYLCVLTACKKRPKTLPELVTLAEQAGFEVVIE